MLQLGFWAQLLKIICCLDFCGFEVVGDSTLLAVVGIIILLDLHVVMLSQHARAQGPATPRVHGLRHHPCRRGAQKGPGWFPNGEPNKSLGRQVTPQSQHNGHHDSSMHIHGPHPWRSMNVEEYRWTSKSPWISMGSMDIHGHPFLISLRQPRPQTQWQNHARYKWCCDLCRRWPWHNTETKFKKTKHLRTPCAGLAVRKDECLWSAMCKLSVFEQQETSFLSPKDGVPFATRGFAQIHLDWLRAHVLLSSLFL